MTPEGQRPACPITHSSLAHPRANLQFTNHISITFIKDVLYCPTCGERLSSFRVDL
jgi:hypothetical protein